MYQLSKIKFDKLPSLTLKPYSQSGEEAILAEHHFRMSVTFTLWGTDFQFHYDEPIYTQLSPKHPKREVDPKINLMKALAAYIPGTGKIYCVKNITLAFWEADRARAIEVASDLITRDPWHKLPIVSQTYQIEEKNDAGAGMGSPNSLPEPKRHDVKSKPGRLVRFASRILDRKLPAEEAKMSEQKNATCFSCFSCFSWKLKKNRVHAAALEENPIRACTPKK